MSIPVTSIPPSRTTQAYQHLVSELRAGTRKPGASISVKDVAGHLRLSPTPIREALERLVGEGVVATSGDRAGFVVPRIGVRGYSSLIETFGLLADTAVASAVVAARRIEQGDCSDKSTLDGPNTSPARATELTFAPSFSRCPNVVIVWLANLLSTILAPYRGAEPQVIDDWADELIQLDEDLRSEKAELAIQIYTRRRLKLAHVIVDAVETPTARSASFWNIS